MRKRFALSVILGACLLLPAAMTAPAFAQQTVAAIIVAELPRYAEAYEAMIGVLRTGGFVEQGQGAIEHVIQIQTG